MFPLAQTIGHAVYQAGAEDPHGNPEDSWADPVAVKVYGYGPRTASTEPGGTQVIVGLTVYAPKSLQVSPRDQFVVDGLRYDVDGELGDWTNGPFGFEPGIEFNLKRVEGGR
jgi:hypothetical protein